MRVDNDEDIPELTLTWHLVGKLPTYTVTGDIDSIRALYVLLQKSGNSCRVDLFWRVDQSRLPHIGQLKWFRGDIIYPRKKYHAIHNQG